jgi:hypothetical protein
MKDPQDMSTLELIDKFESNIRYDAHSLPFKVGRSDAFKELVKRGKTSLTAIGEHIRDNFANKPPTNEVDWDVFKAWLFFLNEFIDEKPYDSIDIPPEEQDLILWANACLKEGNSAEEASNTEQPCWHPTTARVMSHRGEYCGNCGKRF